MEQLFEIIMCIAMLIFLLCMAAWGVYNFLNTTKIINSNLEKAEKQWFYRKTWLGKMQLNWGKRLVADKTNIISKKIGAVLLTVVSLLIFIALLNKIIHYGFPTSLHDPRF